MEPKCNDYHGRKRIESALLFEQISLDKSQKIFLEDTFNHRIMRWEPNAKKGEIVAGEDGTGAELDQQMHQDI